LTLLVCPEDVEMRLFLALAPLFAGSAPAMVGLGAVAIMGASALALIAAVILCALAGAAAFFALARLSPPTGAEEPA
jgi:ethanolamine utilization protein EutA (predicted chaperonin)